jgi:hypothetical protein
MRGNHEPSIHLHGTALGPILVRHHARQLLPRGGQLLRRGERSCSAVQDLGLQEE